MAQRGEFFARPWDSQPQGAFSLSATDRAPIAVAVPHAGGLLIEARAQSERMGFASGTGVRVAAGPLGLGAGSTATSVDAFRLHSTANQTNTVWEKPSTAITMLAVVVRRGNSIGNAPIFGNQSTTASPYTAYALIDGSGSGTHRTEMATGSGLTTLDTGSIPNDVPCVLVGTYDGANLRAYRNGLEVGSAAKTGTIVYPSAANRGPAVGNFYNYSGATRSFVGHTYLVALWDIALTPGEVRALSDNPWQLFEPRRIWVPVSAAAGGGYTLTLDAGAYALSGQSAALGVSRVLSAAAGSYAVAGQAAALKASRALSAAAGSYAVAGQAASFRVSRVLALAAGSYALSGSAATLTYTPGSTTYSLALDAGSYAVSGAAAGLLVGRVLLPAVGAYAVSGKAAAMVYSGSTAIATMPPYITVYMWRRTA